jgi:hypothetical protein
MNSDFRAKFLVSRIQSSVRGAVFLRQVADHEPLL